jgi:hypothetical protein
VIDVGGAPLAGLAEAAAAAGVVRPSCAHDAAAKPRRPILSRRPTTACAQRRIIVAMRTPHARSRFMLLPQEIEATSAVKTPVRRRYSLARLEAPRSPLRPPQRSHPQSTAR